jgi:hypothetical protein
MTESATPPRRHRPRRRPFGVLVICGLLAFQAVLLAILIAGLLEVDTQDMADADLALRAFGLDLSVTTDAVMAIRILIVAFSTLFVLTFVEALLLLMLRRIGWIITMLVVGVALFFQLMAIWYGATVDSISLLLYALTALYLNQSDVRRAFGIGASRIDRVISRSADAVDGAMGDAS